MKKEATDSDIEREFAELGGDFGDDGIDDDDLKELEDMEKEVDYLDSEQPTKRKVSQPKPKQQKKTVIPIGDIENEYHPVAALFGNVLEEELAKILPELRKKYKGDDHFDFTRVLDKKEQDIYKFKIAIAKNVKEGKIDENKYLEILQKILNMNKQLFDKAKKARLPEEDLKRILHRVEGMNFEISEVKKAIEQGGIDVEEEETPKQGEAVFTSYININKSNKRKQNQKNNQPDIIEEEHQTIDNVTMIYFAKKVAMHMAFLEYMKNHLAEERPKQIKELTQKISVYKAKLDEIKANKTKENIEELDAKYPDLSPEFVIGMPRIARNKKIESIFQEIRAEYVNLKDKKLLDIFNKQHLGFVKHLNEIRDSMFGILPSIQKKTIVIPYKEFNNHLKPGELEVRIDKIDLVKAKRQFCLEYAFYYENKEFSHKTSYCSDNGTLKHRHKFKIDSKLYRNFTRVQMVVSLYKKKFILGSKKIAEARVSFNKFSNFINIKEKLVFPYKDNTQMSCTIVLSIKAALSKPSKELDFWGIQKSYPLFTISKDRKSKQQSQVKPKPQPNTQPQKKYPTEAPRKTTKTQPIKKPVSETQALPKSKFKYPIITVAQKKQLAQVIAKNKLPSDYNQFQEMTLSVTYLEQFSGDLEKQITYFRINNDIATSNDAQTQYLNVNKLLNTLVNMIQTDQMSTKEYKNRIDQSILIDEKYLQFFKKIKLMNAVVLVSNRIKVLKQESEQLEAVLADE